MSIKIFKILNLIKINIIVFYTVSVVLIFLLGVYICINFKR